MVDDRAIRRAIVERTGWTSQNVSYHMSKLAHAMSRQHALYVVARRVGIDLEKFGVDSQTLITVGELVDRFSDRGGQASIASTPQGTGSRGQSRSRDRRDVTVKAPGLKLRVPRVGAGVVGAGAVRSIDAFSVVYILENVIREVIRRVLEAEYGEDWWEKGAPQKMRDHADSLLRQDRTHGWLKGRGNDPLYYIGFTEYRKLITGKNWSLFEPLFGRKTLVEETFTTANLVRRAIAHTAPVAGSDLDGLVVDANRILGQLASTEAQLPGA